MPRYKNAEKDFISKQTLKLSKDQAENVMIVDLLRNDLSIYANTGSVKQQNYSRLKVLIKYITW